MVGAEDDRERGDAVYSLMRFGFAAYEHHALYTGGEKIVESSVFKGAQASIALGLVDPVDLVLPKGSGKALDASVELTDPVIAPIAMGAELGTLQIKLRGEAIVSRPLVALSAVDSGSLWQGLTDTVRLWFH